MVSAVGKPGVRLRSAVSAVEIVVVRPAGGVTLQCGGSPMVELDDTGAPADPSGEQVQLGKRYFDEEAGLEVLCTRAGTGPLSVEGRLLQARVPRALPSSD
ncbi:hypothetical protein EDD29_5649 [Actinocorallia herbida]|uniref:Uncharacterized protein n=1 Tax=Actinocorallia herbida TaxID=58109 RepID=A0A3N1D3D0_9ACTN|nr:hypothetical protein [Actinocorallia herbida]ROO87996.1 hypothetical protein EDD29_5649 [Actinocorallia herbida]